MYQQFYLTVSLGVSVVTRKFVSTGEGGQGNGAICWVVTVGRARDLGGATDRLESGV